MNVIPTHVVRLSQQGLSPCCSGDVEAPSDGAVWVDDNVCVHVQVRVDVKVNATTD
jgi:hypothetical protein